MLHEFDFKLEKDKIDNQFQQIDLMNKHAWMIRRSNPSVSLSIASETHELSAQIDYTKGVADSLKNSGTAFYLLSAYESGIIDLNKAKDLYLQLRDKKSESDCIRNLGNIYHSIEEFTKSIEYYKRAKDLSTEINDLKGIAYNLGNIGFVHYLCKRYKKAAKYLQQTYVILQELDDVLGLADVINNIGKNNLALKQFEKAYECYRESLEYSKLIDHKRGIANAYQNLGVFYDQIGDINQSITHLIAAWDTAQEMGEKALMADVAKKISTIYEKMFDYNKSLSFYKKYDELKTDVLKSSNKSAITAIQAQFDVDRLEREKELFKQKNTELAGYKKELEEKNNKLELLSLVASQSDNVIIITDAQGVLSFVNDSFVRFNQATLEEIKLIRGSTIFDISNNPDIRELVKMCIETGKSVTYEVLNISHKGEQFWGSSLLTPVFDRNDELTNLIIIETDVTERKMTEAIIGQKNKDITSSITYGKRIQEAMLPELSKIKNEFSDCFILNKPKDIVSGDFYWFDKLGDHVIFAVSDCTGHGVPGAFMSMIGIDLLNQITDDRSITTPAEVLQSLDTKIKKALKQTGDTNETTDGMDIAFCEFMKDDSDKIVLNYSGAYRPLWLVRNHELIEFKADKFSIGGDVTVDKIFTEYSIETEKEDVFYIFTDGCIDLFGGHKGKKFRANGLKNLLLRIHKLSMVEQEKILAHTFSEWQGDLEQVDDMLIMGFKI